VRRTEEQRDFTVEVKIKTAVDPFTYNGDDRDQYPRQHEYVR